MGIYIAPYADLLVAEDHHCYQSGARIIKIPADYSVWLASKQYKATDVNEGSILKYEQFRQKHRNLFTSDHGALIRFLNILRLLCIYRRL